MALDKHRKARMFAQQNGKCDYCGVDMVLMFTNHNSAPNLATFDHKYNRLHENRHYENNNGEKRIFLVCSKCNSEKSKTEKSENKTESIKEIVKKVIPKKAWTDEMFLERIKKVMEEQIEFSKQIGKIDKQINHLRNEKIRIANKISKLDKYINTINETMKNLDIRNLPQ